MSWKYWGQMRWKWGKGIGNTLQEIGANWGTVQAMGLSANSCQGWENANVIGTKFLSASPLFAPLVRCTDGYLSVNYQLMLKQPTAHPVLNIWKNTNGLWPNWMILAYDDAQAIYIEGPGLIFLASRLSRCLVWLLLFVLRCGLMWWWLGGRLVAFLRELTRDLPPATQLQFLHTQMNPVFLTAVKWSLFSFKKVKMTEMALVDLSWQVVFNFAIESYSLVRTTVGRCLKDYRIVWWRRVKPFSES